MKRRHTGDDEDESTASVAVDLKQREIMLFGFIDSRSAMAMVMALRDVDRTKGPIRVLLNCPGGRVDAGLGIYDTMRHCQNPVDICVVGEASSMGFVLLQAGRKRSAMPHATFLLHDGHLGLESSASEVVAVAMHAARQKTQLQEIIAARSGRSVEEISEMSLRTLALFAQGALNHNFIDEIVEPKEQETCKMKPHRHKSPRKRRWKSRQ